MTIDRRPLILISNDDGYQAKGLNVLIDLLHPIANIVVVAPDGARSGASSAIVSEVPLRYQKVKEEYGLEVYKCNGMPVDCIKLALYTLVPRIPDLIIGGINHGDNSSVNVHYSGTMGVAKEGCIKGIPSVGLSLCNHDWDADFTQTLPVIRKIVEETLYRGLPYGVCLNVNFPNVAEYKGVKVCRQTRGDWSEEFECCNHPRGGKYYWLVGSYNNMEPEATDTDKWALDNGYVAVVPTQIDMTAYGMLVEMKDCNL